MYGGQVLGQALVAAVRTVPEDRIAHSMHGYFLLPGDPDQPIIYDVERVRDGGSFTTRRVKAIQHGRVMFFTSVSFHKAEESFEHQSTMPSVPAPKICRARTDLRARLLEHLPDYMRSYWERERPIELRPVDVSRYFEREKSAPVQHIWMRASGKLPDALPLHQCVLAYASDFTLLDTALIAHGKLCSIATSSSPVSITRSGSIALSGPTNGSCTPRTVRPPMAREGCAAAASTRGTGP